MAAKEMSKVYKLVLNGPGMSEGLKLTFQLSRKQLLLFCLLVENGLSPTKERTEELGGLLSKEIVAELGSLIPEMVKKGGPGLLDYYEELKLL